MAYPLQVVLQPYVERSVGIDAESAFLLAKHAAGFLMFALSVAIFHALLGIFVRDRFIAALFTATYATYPFLFGHGMLSVKDIPFMSAWLLCTYLSIKLVEHDGKPVGVLGRRDQNGHDQSYPQIANGTHAV